MKNHRRPFMLFAFAALVALPVTAGCAGSKQGLTPSSTMSFVAQSSAQESLQVPNPPGIGDETYYVTNEATYLGDVVRVENQARKAEIIIRGVVERVDASRWNSPDGNKWTPDESVAMPVPYTTFWVKPLEIIKGTPKWASPVAFRYAGGAFGPERDEVLAADVPGLPDLKVGDEVIAFGLDEVRYGKGATYTPPAYWLLSDMLSLFSPKNGGPEGEFSSAAGVQDPGIGVTSVAQLRAMVDTIASEQ
ncbi:MAG: hypothetical protein M1274_13850 [Actinobacteria bacterium]|nr:hypothetical protein [Actinomycetota bacterium]